MADRLTFTADQQRAIDARGHNILVAAAAGSGKTRILVERIISQVRNEELQPALQFLIEIQIMMDDCHVFLSCRVQFRIPLHQNVHCAVVSGT